jgi:hypothetical protein
MSKVISFSPWVNSASWNSLAGGKEDQGGVYLFAKFEHEPPLGPADSLEKSVVYIGQSSKSFKSRWHLFFKGLENPTEAKSNPNKYPRALRYMSKFGEDSPPPHVACLPLQHLKQAFLNPGSYSLLDIDTGVYRGRTTTQDFLDMHSELLLKYIEQRLIVLYACHHGDTPVIQEDK